MFQSLRQHAIVQPDGRIVIHVPQLKPGTHAEVTVVENTEPENEAQETVALADLIGSCRGMFATPEEADEFIAREREAWDS